MKINSTSSAPILKQVMKIPVKIAQKHRSRTKEN